MPIATTGQVTRSIATNAVHAPRPRFRPRWAVQFDNAADRIFIAFSFTAAVGLGLRNPDGSRNRR